GDAGGRHSAEPAVDTRHAGAGQWLARLLLPVVPGPQRGAAAAGAGVQRADVGLSHRHAGLVDLAGVRTAALGGMGLAGIRAGRPLAPEAAKNRNTAIRAGSAGR